MLAFVQILGVEQDDELGMVLVIVPDEQDDGAQGCFRLFKVELQRLFCFDQLAIGVFQYQ